MNKMKKIKEKPKSLHTQLLLFFIIIFIFLLIRTAWLNDDAWFTMRTIDNLFHGYGLTWNTNERVQVYTHPLWMFILAFGYIFIREPIFLLIIIPILVSLCVIVLYLKLIPKTWVSATFGVTAIFFSKAYIDYSTSGLENPLSHLILIIFLHIYFSWENNPKKIFYLSVLTALCATNRMDMILVYLPALFYSMYKLGIKRALPKALLGMLPFVLWEVFSIYYYGFPFPNTAYAKLNTGINAQLLFGQGINYLLDSVFRDYVTLPIILFAIILVIIGRKKDNIMVALGILLYILYIVRIGGDNMSGRYLTTIFLCSVVLLTREIGFSSNPEYMIIIALLLIGITTPNPPLLNNLSTASENRYHGVSDTKANSYEYTSLWNINIMNPQLHGVQYEKGMLARETQKRITIGKASGKFAFYAGPDHHVVDTFALGDALLARLPPREQVNFHIGHFVRDVPKGYWKNYWSYGDKIQDPSLAEYYQKLSIVIHGNTLFSKQRFIEIWRLNTGYYDHLIDEYLVREAAP